MSKLLILGAGGHGKVVVEAAASMGRWDDIAFLDDRYPELQQCLSWPITGEFSDLDEHKKNYQAMAVALGDNELRLKQLDTLANSGIDLPVIVHQSAVISPSVHIDAGTVIFANVVINADANIGMGSIINTGATVDHDCILGKGVHLSPGVHLGGNVKIGDRSWLGIGASVINEMTIGEDVIVGAGAVVIDDVLSAVKVVGMPAGPIRK